MSNIRLYSGVKFTAKHNFIVDNIEYYLSTLPSVSFSKVQFIRTSLITTVKLPILQEQLDNLIPFIDNYNYLSVENFLGHKEYYFIASKRWASSLNNNSEPTTIYLDLVLDTLNSFKDGEAFNFTPRTNILRQHFERFSSYNYDSSILGYSFRRKIHEASEGLNYSTIIKDSYKIEDTGVLNQNFYLITNTRIDPDNPEESGRIELNLSTENVTTFKIDYTPLVITADDFDFVRVDENNVNVSCYWFFYNDFNKDITINNNVLEENKAFVLFSYSDLVYYAKVTYPGSNDRTAFTLMGSMEELEITGVQQYYKSRGNIYTALIDPSSNPNRFSGIFEEDKSTLLYAKALDYSINTVITEWDRTMSNISSILLLPYSPNDFEERNGALLIDSINSNFLFNVKENRIEYKNLNAKYKHSIKIPSAFTSPLYFNFLSITPSYDVLRNSRKDDPLSVSMESKLFHSDYFYNKFIYDNFNYLVRYENLNTLNVSLTNQQYINFKTTSSLKSRFLFELPLLSNPESTYERILDYEGIFISNRNNELPLFNSAYLNYIRTAYNYDVKNKEIDSASRWLNTGVSIATSVSSQIATGGFNPITTASSAFTGIYSNLISDEKADLNIEAKLYQSAMQSINVSGSDDVDLFEYYSDNRVYMKSYNVKEYEKILLYNLFFYTGYKCNIYGIPTHNSRNRFDYLQCVLDIVLLKGLPQYIIDDLTQKYYSGVTYIHKYNDTYDFIQEYNNIESSLG